MLYDELDQLSEGLDLHIVNFNDYRNVTSQGFKEVYDLNSNIKSEIMATAYDKILENKRESD